MRPTPLATMYRIRDVAIAAVWSPFIALVALISTLASLVNSPGGGNWGKPNSNDELIFLCVLIGLGIVTASGVVTLMWYAVARKRAGRALLHVELPLTSPTDLPRIGPIRVRHADANRLSLERAVLPAPARSALVSLVSVSAVVLIPLALQNQRLGTASSFASLVVIVLPMLALLTIALSRRKYEFVRSDRSLLCEQYRYIVFRVHRVSLTLREEPNFSITTDSIIVAERGKLIVIDGFSADELGRWETRVVLSWIRALLVPTTPDLLGSGALATQRSGAVRSSLA